MFESSSVVFAFSLTLFAGLSTGIGSALAFFAKRTNTKLLTIALGFSAGVMIYVSFIEIFPKAKDCLAVELGEVGGFWVTVLAFFSGIVFIGIIDRLVPSFENPHEIHKVEEMYDTAQVTKSRKLYRMGLFAALAIGIHNFPEEPAKGLMIMIPATRITMASKTFGAQTITRSMILEKSNSKFFIILIVN